MKKALFLTLTHGVCLALGFALGVYLLPILTAPASPDAEMLEQKAQSAMYSAELTRELRGSDLLHWGEGTISLTETEIVHEGKLAPGPDYKLYLVPQFVEHEDEFEPIKDQALQVGDIKTFAGFVLDLPEGVDLSQYNTVVVWCEAFSEFITAGQFR
ncbi:DM13 domain-containing protein [Thalassococcus lentus]|uniref:DM13 domain-containing protein n=1 Tax=Thalassococcus lentus TaxID=1210524 RepID=A0ABT4XQJ9_9RHOB|nr:DM13 domain-containing protein [Thalassococcus lentus]MDA7424224.1 DM13 domain-containing protein [Thalassococcus lentus]